MKMEREHFIDRLRVMAVLVVFVFHCLRFFDPFPWHLKNPVRHDLVMLPVAWINAWSMELFFLLSGFGSWFALGNRALIGYLKARFLRLLLPVYTVGIFLLLLSVRQYRLVIRTLGGEEIPPGYWVNGGVLVNVALALLGLVLAAYLVLA